MARMLELQWYEEGVTPSEPTVVQGTCAMGQKTVQNAGKAFWDQFELPLCKDTVRESGDAPEVASKEDRELNEREKAFKEKRAKREQKQKESDGGLLKISEDLKGKDLYELMELEASVTDADVKKAYRKLVLVHHPDKMTDPTEDQKKHFLLIQEAFDILSDPVKRRRYESTLKFDDAIPSDLTKGYANNFFEKFRPVFKRNARWSTRSGVPELGDEETPIEKVKQFYDFWHDFDSWRDPLAMAETDEVELHNLEEAECREEKRWMERENAKVARKIKAGERERISDLTKFSEKHDPRMIAYRAQVAAEKEAKAAGKAAAKEAEKSRLEAEARAAAEAAEAARLLEEGKRQAEKKAKEETKNALKTARQRVRNLHKNAAAVVRHAVHMDQLQEVCLRLGTEDLCKLADDLEAALALKSQDCCEAVELLHIKIKDNGATPIKDESVSLEPEVDSESTATPASDNEEEAQREPQGSPEKMEAEEPTAEELEAERVLAEAQEAEEKLKREKKAEEQRKKREQKKREDEKRDAAKNRADAALRAKERKAQEKASAKESEKVVEKSAAPTPKAQPKTNNTGIAKNVILVVTEDATVFASPESSDEISEISEGSFLVAAGPPVDVDGFDMVPLQPCGSVELRVVRRMEANAAADTSPVTEKVAAEEQAPVKTTSSKKVPIVEEEDLDNLLSEFGVVLSPVSKTKKKAKK